LTAARNLLFVIVAWLACPTAAVAHSMPQSMVYLDIGSAAVRIECSLPLAELQLALPELHIGDERHLSKAQQNQLIAYGLRHIRLEGVDGERWTVGHAIVTLQMNIDHRDIIYRADYRRPANSQSLRLRYDAITHEVVSHVALVAIRGDFSSSDLARTPEMVGMLQNPADSLAISMGHAPARGLFASATKMGIGHILTGYDHMLFLLSLVLVLPLTLKSGEWTDRKQLRDTAIALAKVITAFTVGHSITLLASTMLEWRLPTALVELCVAATVLVAAINIWKPIFAGREVVAAVLFGLIHGIAFASAIGQHLLDPVLRFEVILGFNLGIELVQLLLASLVVLPAWSAASLPQFARVRLVAALIVAGIAGYWFVERIPAVPAEFAELANLREPEGIATVVLIFVIALATLLTVSGYRIVMSPLRFAASCSKSSTRTVIVGFLGAALAMLWIGGGTPMPDDDASAIAQAEHHPAPPYDEDFEYW
jgi:hypothetical protein